MRYLSLFVMVFSLGLLGMSAVSAQSADGWTVVKTEALETLIGGDHNLHYITLSPDGKTLAWGEAQSLCLYTIDRTESECYGTPDTFKGFGGNYSLLVWSPDSRSIAFTESLFDFFVDSDIWLFDVESKSFEDRTDDNYLGGLINFDEDKPEEEPHYIDYLPTWNPVNGDLYFFRSIRPEEGDITMTLQLMPLGRTEPKQVADFSTTFPVLSVFRQAAISPDGKTMAVIVLGNDLKDPQNGIYLVNLKDGSAKRILTTDQFTLGLPEWAIENARALYPDTAPRWVGNDALVLTLLDSSFGPGLSTNALYIDLASEQVTPLIDYSVIPDQVSLFQDMEDLSSPIYLVSRAGVVTPDNSAFLFLSGVPQARSGVISTISLPASQPTAPTQIGQIDEFTVGRSASAAPQISDDGTRALLFGYLVTLQPPA